MQTAGLHFRRAGLALLLATAVLLSQPVHADAESAAPEYERVRVLPAPRTVGDPQFTDQDGAPFRIAALRGKVVLVFFGFTHCPDVCPLTLARWRELASSGGVDPERTGFVLVSVDGERDTPPVLKAFLARFSDRFTGLTAEPATVRQFAKAFSAPFFKGATSAAGGTYDVMHSPRVYVLDEAGRLRAEFYSPATDVMARYIRSLYFGS